MSNYRSVAACVALGLVMVALSACGGASSLPDELTRQLDIPNNSVAILGEATSEDISRLDLLSAVDRAEALGADLRIVVAGDDYDLVSAAAITEEYGGTALSYEAGDVGFETHSREMTQESLLRAKLAAETERDMGASALAFVRVIEGDDVSFEGGDRGGLSWLWIVLAALALAFFVYQLWRFLRARRRAQRRRERFASRRDILADWAVRLGPDLDAVAAQQSRLGIGSRQLLEQAGEQVSAVRAAVDQATTIGELDAAEIRLARAATKIRTLRQALVRQG